MNRGQLFSLVFPNLLILNDRLQIFVQYHFGGLSRCTLIGLLRVSDIEPASIGLPTFGDDLNQNSPHWRVRNVRDTIAAGLYIHFQFLVLLQGVLFDEFHVHAGVLNGNALLTAGHFNGDPRLYIARRRRSLRLDAAAGESWAATPWAITA